MWSRSRSALNPWLTVPRRAPNIYKGHGGSERWTGGSPGTFVWPPALAALVLALLLHFLDARIGLACPAIAGDLPCLPTFTFAFAAC